MYHVIRQGQKLGVFPLEEVRRRRSAGEFNGSELAWGEGMARWLPIDAILQPSSAPVPPPAPPFLPRTVAPRKSNPAVAVIIVAAVLLFVGMMAFVAYTSARIARTVRLASRPRAGGSEGVELAAKPIHWTTNTITEAEAQKHAKAFRVRQWVDGYKNRGVRKPEYDPLALRFLDTWLAENYDRQVESTNRPSISQMADQLAGNPACDDPLLLAVTGANCIELNEGIHRLQRALDGFEASRYLAYPKFYTMVTLSSKVPDDRGRVAALDASALKQFATSFTDGSFLPEDQPELAEILLHGWGSAFFARHGASVYRAAAEAGKNFEWLALVLEGEHEINLAWRSRGGGYANTVSEQGWAGFTSHLAAADRYLTRAWQLRPDLPQAPDRMISVSLGQSGLPEMRTWFERALSAQIDYPEAWSDMRWGLRPRWHGSLEAMLALGVEAVNSKRFDTDVPRKLFDVIRDIESEERVPPDRHIYGRPDIWPHLREMYEGYIAAPSQAANRAGWQSTYAAVAYLAGHYDVARAQLQAIDWKLAPWNLSGWGSDLSLMPLEVAARTGPASNVIAKAEQACAHGNLTEAIQLYSAPTETLDARTQQYIRCRLACLGLEKRLEAGEWVDFLPADDGDPNWVALYGSCKRLPDGGVEVRASHDGHLVYCRAVVGPNFEIRGSFERATSSNKDFQAGLVMGLPELYAYHWYSFRMKRNETEGDVASFAYAFSKQQIYQPVKLADEWNAFSLLLQGGKVTATVNGKPVFQEARPPRSIRVASRQFRVGLGAFNDMNDTVLRYRHVQLRKLLPGKTPETPAADDE